MSLEELTQPAGSSCRGRRRSATAIQYVAALRRRIARDQKDGATKCDGATMFFMRATVSGNERGGSFGTGMFRIGAGSSECGRPAELVAPDCLV